MITTQKGQILKNIKVKKGNQDKFNYILNSNKLQFYYRKEMYFFFIVCY